MCAEAMLLCFMSKAHIVLHYQLEARPHASQMMAFLEMDVCTQQTATHKDRQNYKAIFKQNCAILFL